MRILLIRHGEPDYTTDTLTAKGRVEAELLSRRMEKYDIRDFYTSPLGRARETAGYTLRRMGREAETLEWLREFRGRIQDPQTGKMTVCWDRPPRIWMRYPESYDAEKWADIPIYEGTNVRPIWEETKRGIDDLLARYGFRKEGKLWMAERNTPETIALFCHFGISMAVLAYLTNTSPMILWHHTLTVTSSVSEVVTEERVPGEISFRVTKIGDSAHLEMNGEPRSAQGLFPECYTGVDSTDANINGMPLRRDP